MELIITIVTAIANLTMGLAVYNKNPKSATNKSFTLLTFVIALWTITNYISLQYTNPQQALFWIRIVMAIAATMFTVLYVFAITFPYNHIPLTTKKRVFILLETTLIALLGTTPAVFRSATLSTTGTITPNPGIAMPLYALHILSYLTLTLIILIKKRNSSSHTIRSQINLMLLGLAATFILATISNFLLVILFGNTNLVILGPTYTIILVGAIAYAIIKHRFLDVTSLVFRAISFAILTLIIIAIYAILLFNFLKIIPAQYQTSLSIILAVFLVYTYNPLKNLIEKLTKNIFYKSPYSSEKLLESLGKIIRSTLSIQTLGRNTLEELIRTMHISRGALVIYQNGHGLQIIHEGFVQKPIFTENNYDNLKTSAKNQLIIFDDIEESPTKMVLRQLQVSIVVPLKVKSTTHGLLIMGEKASGEIYSQQDINVLEILMPQLSVAVQNAKSYEEIKGFADTLKEEVDSATSDLKKANRNLRHLDKLKDEFVFIATHELKNPVTAMKGYLSMLFEGLFGPIPEKFKDPLNQLQYSNQQLVDLVNDLLQIARAEAKTLQIETKPIDLSQVITFVIQNLKPLAEQKHMTITYKSFSDKPLMVLADDTRCKEIMNNLVSNAIKYSESGNITISHEMDAHDMVTHVADQGFGIADKDKAKIFTKFFRVDEEAAKGIPGTGLGLFIVKEIIEKMGGKIWFTSTYGKGTTFTFTLPKA